ncbi:serine hydrolase domain-containing protein [Kangiella koreensis]|uniref:Beta-lactamase n=1 Tax=Kangiella koreensis (strain DSM 16069 / JCM 12317 / KCTC 12182 / SW-125) TaxID=523791 RepID=C7R688_KANKD|nr:serine hydrolase domain-containing protein [Kangiella koreensis]ACV25519.1 beta-lactamase [Kangiella koreensis DSM 16069]
MKRVEQLVAILTCSIIVITASGKEVGNDQDLSISAIDRIEKNLLPNHYLDGHVTPKSIPQVMLEEKIPGVSIVFIDDGKIAWCKAYGYADLEKAKLVTSETVFTGASLSKPIAAVTALRLVDKGLVSLDEDINHKLEGWTIHESDYTKDKKVTLRHLIGHTAGVKNFVYGSYDEGQAIPTTVQILEGTSPSINPSAEMMAVPGEQYKYSNPGYTIIELLIEDITGKGFEEVVEEGVLSRANMKDSSFVQPAPQYLMKRKATGYSNELKAYPYRLFPFQAAGGIWTTPQDLAKFMIALMDDYHEKNNTLVSKKIADQIFAKDKARLGFTKKYNEESGDLVFDHWGSNEGFTSYMVGSLGDKQGLVIMTNSDNGFGLMAAISRAVAQEYDWDLHKPRVYKATSIEENKLEAFAGKFGDGKDDGEVNQFTIIDDVLNLSLKESKAAQELVPIGDNIFIAPSQYVTYEFLKGKDGSIKWVRVTHESGWNYDLIKYQ